MTGTKSKRCDLRLEMRVKNNVLWRAIHDSYPTVSAFCRAHNLHQTEVGQLISFKISPLRKVGEYRTTAVRLSEILGILTTELFSPRLYANILETGSFKAVEVSSFTALPRAACKEIRMLPAPVEQGPDAQCAKAEWEDKKNETLKEVLKELSYREREIIKLHYGLGEDRETHTIEQVAAVFKLTGARIRQIEARAIRKLQEPGLSQLLARFVQ